MGADFYASAVVGVKMTKGRLKLPPKRVKAFDHDYDEGTTYCPKSGRKLWAEEEVFVDGYDPDNEKFGKYRVVDVHYDHDGIVVGKAVTTDSDGGQQLIKKLKDLPDLEKFKQELQAYLAERGLWDEKAFGIYAVLSISV